MCHDQPLLDPNSPQSQQSPINLHDPIYVGDGLGANGLDVQWHEEVPLNGHVVADDHGIKVAFESDDRHYIRLGGRKYILLSFHFHSRSEHWREGRQFPVELHIVHQNPDDGTLAVVAVFITSDGEEAKTAVPCARTSQRKHPTPSLIAQMLTILRDQSDHQDAPSVSTNPHDFLPDRPSEYYRYEGSLTTKPFSENVSWAVLRNPFWMDDGDLEKLKSEFKEAPRFPWPLNRRFVLATFPPEGASTPSHARLASKSASTAKRKKS